MPKPRKRRTQTLAEKSTNGGKMYPWQNVMGSYCFAPVPEVWATLKEQEGQWLMNVKLNGQKFHGERPTLEDAFKATAGLLYKHAREFWLNMDGRVVTADFHDFLKGEL